MSVRNEPLSEWVLRWSRADRRPLLSRQDAYAIRGAGVVRMLEGLVSIRADSVSRRCGGCCCEEGRERQDPENQKMLCHMTSLPVGRPVRIPMIVIRTADSHYSVMPSTRHRPHDYAFGSASSRLGRLGQLVRWSRSTVIQCAIERRTEAVLILGGVYDRSA